MTLIKYRDAGMHTYTYFWVKGDKTVSPYFDCERDAQKWLDDLLGGGAMVSTGQ